MNKEDIEYTLKDTNGNKYTIIDTKKVDIQEKLNKEINKLIAESTEWESKCYNLQEKISKAIEYLEFECEGFGDEQKAIAILKGDSNE